MFRGVDITPRGLKEKQEEEEERQKREERFKTMIPKERRLEKSKMKKEATLAKREARNEPETKREITEASVSLSFAFVLSSFSPFLSFVIFISLATLDPSLPLSYHTPNSLSPPPLNATTFFQTRTNTRRCFSPFRSLSLSFQDPTWLSLVFGGLPAEKVRLEDWNAAIRYYKDLECEVRSISDLSLLPSYSPSPFPSSPLSQMPVT